LTKPPPKNLPASVRQKLASLARERNVDFGLILVKYGLERILFRLSRSRYSGDFILKQLTFDKQFHGYPTVCDQGRNVVYERDAAGSFHLWRLDLQSGASTQLTNG